MQQLMYSGEVRTFKDIDVEKSEVKPAEQKLAKHWIDAQTNEKYDPTQYRDEVSGRIEAAIAKKVEGQEITLSDAPAASAQVIDLMEALRASLDRKPPKKGASAPKADDARKPAKRATAEAVAAPAPKKKARSG